MPQGTICDPKAALAYMLAGRATITFRSVATGARFTYKIKPSDAEALKAGKQVRFFVKVLNGCDNTSDFLYIGQIYDGQFTITKKTRDNGMSYETPSIAAFKWAYTALAAGHMPGNLEVYHSGKCGRCGRKLTVPESVLSGFGPECINLVGLTAPVLSVAAAVGGTAVPQKAKFHIPTPKMSGMEAARAIYAPATVKCNGKPHVSPEMDVRIRGMVADYKSNQMEDYWHDGALLEPEAFEVAYNKFRVELSKGQ